jgi:hypothetical protein
MASTGMLRSFYDPALYTSHVPQTLLNWRPYSPSVVLTLIGISVLAICWTTLVKTNPSGEWIVAMGVLQVAWIISLSEIWAQNVSSLLRWGSCYAGQQTKDQTSRR